MRHATARAICYTSHADKATRFRSVTIPAIRAEALAGANDPVLWDWMRAEGVLAAPQGPEALRALHDAMRRGAYWATTPAHCDDPAPVADIIIGGGDCDQWAAVAAAACLGLGYPCRLVLFGRGVDLAQHVAVEAYTAWRWWLMDAKGSQAGLPFDTVPPLPATERVRI